MRKLMLSLVSLSMFGLLSPAPIHGQKVEKEGAAWLEQYNEPAGANIAGEYTEKQWGKVTLVQAPDSREVTGKGDGWDINGVVSGKKVYLILSSKGKVNYCAELVIESEKTLNGGYSNGMMKPNSKTRKMFLTK